LASTTEKLYMAIGGYGLFGAGALERERGSTRAARSGEVSVSVSVSAVSVPCHEDGSLILTSCSWTSSRVMCRLSGALAVVSVLVSSSPVTHRSRCSRRGMPHRLRHRIHSIRPRRGERPRPRLCGVKC
jgi:hypothetical protein